MARSATGVLVLSVLTLVATMTACTGTNGAEDPPRTEGPPTRVVGYAYTDTHARGERIAMKAPCNCCPFTSASGKNVAVRSAVILPRPRR